MCTHCLPIIPTHVISSEKHYFYVDFKLTHKLEMTNFDYTEYKYGYFFSWQCLLGGNNHSGTSRDIQTLSNWYLNDYPRLPIIAIHVT